MRPVTYGATAGLLALAGTVLLGGLHSALHGGDLITGVIGGVIGLVWGAALSLPLGVLWMLVLVGTLRLIGRRRWWAGASAGLLAGAAVAAVLLVVLECSLTSSEGGVAQQRALMAEERWALLPSVLGSAVAGAVPLVHLARGSGRRLRGPTRRTSAGSGAQPRSWLTGGPG
ncbi:hypothetical protein [Rathayibacter sp. VKM Ac-2630]|uniref:hypothetical protein n=1 Tax=Rathayibacter sp. VKM Ac-2630 TaxID=1938617 RepID=UPI0011158885|nr:hypothetical protein [Rathayibacter sp. VKM Ac-2630]